MKLNSANINVMVKACRKAAKIMIRDFGEIENLQVSLKGPGDYVTASDKKVEKILIEELQKARPNYSILSEEFWAMMTQKGILNNGDTLSYASGLRIETYKGQKTIGHGGGFVGFRSSFVRFPEQKFSVVIFSNRRDANLSKMSMEVAEIFLIDKLIHRQFST